MILVLLSSRRGRGRPMFAFFLFIVAAIPILASSIFVWLGSFNQKSPDYWAVAPGLIFLAAMLYTGPAVVLAAITGLAYRLTRGDNAKKARWALGCFTILFLAMLAFAG